eukprot:4837431-Alexandrium_andersonii.AAC.1
MRPTSYHARAWQLASLSVGGPRERWAIQRLLREGGRLRPRQHQDEPTARTPPHPTEMRWPNSGWSFAAPPAGRPCCKAISANLEPGPQRKHERVHGWALGRRCEACAWTAWPGATRGAR